MDLLTRTELVDLAQARSDGSRVSLYMPTHRFGDGVQGDPLRWKNLVTGVESALAEQVGAREASACSHRPASCRTTASPGST